MLNIEILTSKTVAQRVNNTHSLSTPLARRRFRRVNYNYLHPLILVFHMVQLAFVGVSLPLPPFIHERVLRSYVSTPVEIARGLGATCRRACLASPLDRDALS